MSKTLVLILVTILVLTLVLMPATALAKPKDKREIPESPLPILFPSLAIVISILAFGLSLRKKKAVEDTGQ